MAKWGSAPEKNRWTMLIDLPPNLVFATSSWLFSPVENSSSVPVSFPRSNIFKLLLLMSSTYPHSPLQGPHLLPWENRSNGSELLVISISVLSISCVFIYSLMDKFSFGAFLCIEYRMTVEPDKVGLPLWPVLWPWAIDSVSLLCSKEIETVPASYDRLRRKWVNTCKAHRSEPEIL